MRIYIKNESKTENMRSHDIVNSNFLESVGIKFESDHSAMINQEGSDHEVHLYRLNSIFTEFELKP